MSTTELIVPTDFDRLSQFVHHAQRLFGGVQIVFKFPNNYGASVIRHSGSYGGSQGLYELGVLKFTAPAKYDLVYDTPITNDVLGWLSVDDILSTLDEIQALEQGGA
jgi:hypothetical protein